jgi:hypothetical protein
MSEPGRIPPSRKTVRLIFAIIVLAVIGWQVFSTEMRVAELRSRGFTDVAIDSTRDHAYLPLIGGVLGAALFIGIGLAIKRAVRRRDDGRRCPKEAR